MDPYLTLVHVLTEKVVSGEITPAQATDHSERMKTVASRMANKIRTGEANYKQDAADAKKDEVDSAPERVAFYDTKYYKIARMNNEIPPPLTRPKPWKDFKPSNYVDQV
jgi:hypothetical protein